MLDLMPGGISKAKFIQRGPMPDPGCQDEEQQAGCWMCQHMQDTMKSSPRKEWSQPVLPHPVRQSSQHGDTGSAEPDEWWRYHHEQQVLQHVCLKQKISHRIQW